jgi:hypothetical protein
VVVGRTLGSAIAFWRAIGVDELMMLFVLVRDVDLEVDLIQLSLRGIFTLCSQNNILIILHRSGDHKNRT